MRFLYNLDQIVGALTYNDLKGLLNLLDKDKFFEQNLTIAEMEEAFKESFLDIRDRTTFKKIESLMLSCARVNSIGF